MSVELIKALQNPTLYDHPTEGFEVIETHISWVILTGPYAYKIKKTVNFGFLDFSTLEKRAFCCQEELRLNRRLAEDLYLDVVPITGSFTHPKLVAEAQLSSTDSVIEYALKMTQFDQKGLLDRRQETQTLTSGHIKSLAAILAQFHQSVDTTIPNNHFGTAKAIFAPVIENFEQINTKLTQLSLTGEIPLLEPLQQWAKDTFHSLKCTLENRRMGGFIRECHGDLHLGNITLQHGETVIFDCIEFNASLSWIDVISDLAFLVMDLEQRGQTVYANQLVNQYIEHTGDYQGIVLLQFYKAYRAMVRAKVAILSLQVINDQQTTNEQLANAELQANNNRLLMDRFHQYAALANRYTTPPTPFILVMHGFSGSGKSHISQSLAEQLGAIRIRTDVERKRLFSFHATANTESPVDGGIYTSQATEKTYQHVAGLASVLLKGMVPVVIDGANLKHWQRQLFSEIAKDHDVPFTIISCHADSHILQDRIVQRAARPSQDKERDASEAKLETLAHQQRFSDPLSNEEFGVSIQVNTGQSNRISSIVEQINKCLNINTKLV